ncbi:MAG: hypothetical protein U0325_12875 [Polyangiales bacterium]
MDHRAPGRIAALPTNDAERCAAPRPRARRRRLGLLLLASLLLPDCRALFVQSPETNAEQAAWGHVFHAPPAQVWAALQRATAPTVCGAWPRAEVTEETLRRAGDALTLSTAPGPAGHVCSARLRPRRILGGYTVDLLRRNTRDRPDHEGNPMSRELLRVIAEVEPAAAEALRQEGARATAAQQARWGGCSM